MTVPTAAKIRLIMGSGARSLILPTNTVITGPSNVGAGFGGGASGWRVYICGRWLIVGPARYVVREAGGGCDIGGIEPMAFWIAIGRKREREEISPNDFNRLQVRAMQTQISTDFFFFILVQFKANNLKQTINFDMLARECQCFSEFVFLLCKKWLFLNLVCMLPYLTAVQLTIVIIIYLNRLTYTQTQS